MVKKISLQQTHNFPRLSKAGNAAHINKSSVGRFGWINLYTRTHIFISDLTLLLCRSERWENVIYHVTMWGEMSERTRPLFIRLSRQMSEVFPPVPLQSRQHLSRKKAPIKAFRVLGVMRWITRFGSFPHTTLIPQLRLIFYVELIKWKSPDCVAFRLPETWVKGGKEIFRRADDKIPSNQQMCDVMSCRELS